MAWNLELGRIAKQKSQFLLVNDERGETKRVNILDASALWRTEPAIVFQTGYRIAGTSAAITATLTSVGLAADVIQNVLDTSITVINYLTVMSSVFDEEVQKYNAYHKAAVQANINSQGYRLFDIITAVNPDILRLVKNKKTAKAHGLPALNITPGTSSFTARTVDSKLLNRVPAVDSGKVLDVSKLIENGTGARVTNAPKTGRKLYSPTLAMVADDIEHYMLAISMFPGGLEKYMADVNFVRSTLNMEPLQPAPFIEAKAEQPAIVSSGVASFHPAPSNMVPTKIRPIYSKKERDFMRNQEALKVAATKPVSLVSNPVPGPITIPIEPSQSPEEEEEEELEEDEEEEEEDEEEEDEEESEWGEEDLEEEDEGEEEESD